MTQLKYITHHLCLSTRHTFAFEIPFHPTKNTPTLSHQRKRAKLTPFLSPYLLAGPALPPLAVPKLSKVGSGKARDGRWQVWRTVSMHLALLVCFVCVSVTMIVRGIVYHFDLSLQGMPKPPVFLARGLYIQYWSTIIVNSGFWSFPDALSNWLAPQPETFFRATSPFASGKPIPRIRRRWEARIDIVLQ